jgi:hypothetical protein
VGRDGKEGGLNSDKENSEEGAGRQARQRSTVYERAEISIRRYTRTRKADDDQQDGSQQEEKSDEQRGGGDGPGERCRQPTRSQPRL